jgi:hypothetical protein
MTSVLGIKCTIGSNVSLDGLGWWMITVLFVAIASSRILCIE